MFRQSSPVYILASLHRISLWGDASLSRARNQLLDEVERTLLCMSRQGMPIVKALKRYW
jgi:hypothetical protein